MNKTNGTKNRNEPNEPPCSPLVAPGLAFEELQSTLEELRVADEELRVQNEELAGAREVIEAERARYADLFEFAPDAYFVTTPAGVIREANRAAAQLLQIAPGLLPGKPFVTFVAPDARPDFRARLLDLAQTGRIADWEVTLAPRHGAPFPAALTVAAVRAGERGGAGGLRWLARDIGERVRAEQARQELLRRLVSAQEAERRHIARELHDEMGQHLTALLLGLKSLRDVLPADPAPVQERLRQLQGIADQMGREVHHLALELRPTALDDLGLCIALRGYVEAWEQRTNVPTDFHVGGFGTARLPAHLETTIYRTVQEALTNVARHARNATRVSVILERRDSHVLAIVEDNGAGFDAEAAMQNSVGGKAAGRLGLLGMRERVALAGGTVTIESSPGNGTTIFLRVPLPASAGEKPAHKQGTTPA